MDKLAKEYNGKIKVYKVNVDKEKKLAGSFNVKSIPTVLFIPMKGHPLMQVGALSEQQYKQIIEKDLLDK
jgi:Thioredoxin domain-containing protein